MTDDEVDRLDAELDWLQDAIDERIALAGDPYATFSAIVKMAEIILQSNREAAN